MGTRVASGAGVAWRAGMACGDRDGTAAGGTGMVEGLGWP